MLIFDHRNHRRIALADGDRDGRIIGRIGRSDSTGGTIDGVSYYSIGQRSF